MKKCAAKDLMQIYRLLLDRYGPQGWWPLLHLHEVNGMNPTKTGSVNGYHPNDFSFPHNSRQRFEICVGAILTQNAAWPNVEQSLILLESKDLLDPEEMIGADDGILKECIRPSGYYNQKAKKLRVFAQFYLALKDDVPSREELLSLWGIGPETADCILLYGYGMPSFVVDAYTRRFLEAMGIITEKASYDEVKKLFESSLDLNVNLFQEYHALLVEHGKRFYSKKPYGCDVAGNMEKL